MSVANAADDISASARGWRCVAMLAGPVSLFVGILAAPLPLVGGQFEPAALAWWASFAFWLLYAAALVHLLERYRLAKGGTFGAQGKRRGVTSFGDVLIIGGFAWIWLSVMTAGVLAGSINEAFGTARPESATVQDKWATKGKGCHFHVQVAGTTVESGTVLCMEQAAWNGVDVDSTLPLVVRASALGRRIGLAAARFPVSKDQHE